MSSPLINRLLAVSAALLLAAPVSAQLAALSPFMATGARVTNVPTGNAPLEFRGVADLRGGAAFRVVDPARKAGAWVHLNEPDPDLGFVVKQHDAEHETVVVEHQGRTYTLSLRQSKIASAGAPMPQPMLAQNMVLPPPPAAVAAQPSTAVQQQQLKAVAAAVAQRRVLREQAQQQISQGVPLAPQVIQQNAPPQKPGSKKPGDSQNGGSRSKPRTP